MSTIYPFAVFCSRASTRDTRAYSKHTRLDTALAAADKANDLVKPGELLEFRAYERLLDKRDLAYWALLLTQDEFDAIQWEEDMQRECQTDVDERRT